MFGTFLGVSFALYGFDITNDNLTEAIAPLINGLTVASWTTVGGLATYLLGHFAIRFIEGNQSSEQTRRDPQDILESIEAHVSDESTIVTLQNIDNTLVNTHNLIANFSTALSESLSSSMQQIMETVNIQMSEQMGVNLREFGESVNNLLEYQTKNNEINQLNLENLNESKKMISEVTQILGKTSKEISRSNDIIDRRNEQLQRQDDILDSWSSKLSEMNERMISTYEDLSNTLKEHQNQMEAAVHNMDNGVSEKMEKFVSDLEVFCNGLYASINEIYSRISEEYTSQSAKHHEMLKEYLVGTLQEFDKQLKSLAESYTEHMKESINVTDTGATEHLQKLQETMNTTLKTLDSSLSTFDKNLTHTLSTLDNKQSIVSSIKELFSGDSSSKTSTPTPQPRPVQSVRQNNEIDNKQNRDEE